MNAVILESELTCPRCGFAKRESMPTDACQFYYECGNCKTLLRPNPGDCCVFCSFGSVKCPPVQAQRVCCGQLDMPDGRLARLSATLIEVLPKLSEQEQRISLALYRLLAAGLPISGEQIAGTLNLPGDVIEKTLHQWWGVYYNAQQRVVGYWGLALPQTAHRLTIQGKTLYAWCAWDTLFIPELIGQTIDIESHCPVTEQSIRLTVGPLGIIRRDPADMAMSLIVPEDAKIRENVVAHFCHYVHFFCSAEAGAKWVLMHPGTLTVSIEEAYALGKAKNAAQYKEALTAEV